MEVDGSLAGSLRVRLLSGNPWLRELARRVVHLAPGLWSRVNGSYAGPVEFEVAGLHCRYLLGANDTIGDILYWQGAKQWEPEVTGEFVRLAKSADGLILDIGANCGIYTVLAGLANSRVSVKAWEPVPFLNERVRLNVQANGLEGRTEVRQAALGAAASSAKFFLHDDATMGSLSDVSGEGRAIEVRVETVDGVIEPGTRVSLVKIDVEGHEPAALAGMRRVLEESHPPVIFECLSAAHWAPVTDLLRMLGYGFWALEREGKVRVESFKAGTTNYLAA